MSLSREQIIRMAREADGHAYTNRHMKDEPAFAFSIDRLERLVNAAYAAGAAAEREALSRIRAPKPRELPQVGTGALLSEQRFCFEKGYREGAAALRKAIRARGNGGEK